jgi:cystine transport system ATP-binding protein
MSPDPITPPPSEAETVLEVTGLAKSFGATSVLASVDLTLRAGRVVCLIGPSGSGKTTVLRSLNGLETPDGGTLRAPGAGLDIDFSGPVDDATRNRLRDLSAMVFQQHNLFPHLTVIENVIEGPLRVQRRPRDEVIAEARSLLERVGLDARRDAYPSELSGGQQQRVGIVRALALRPRLLLFDEPTSALDPELVGDVLSVMKDLADEGWTMAVVTHELAFARDVADEVLFLNDGVVLERGAPERIFTAPREERTRRFLERLMRPF